MNTSDRATISRLKAWARRDGEKFHVARSYTTDCRNYYLTRDGVVVAAWDTLEEAGLEFERALLG